MGEVLIQSGTGKGKSLYSTMIAGQLSLNKKVFFISDELRSSIIYNRLRSCNICYNSKNLVICDSYYADKIIPNFKKHHAIIIDFVYDMETLEKSVANVMREDLIITGALNRQSAYYDAGDSNSSLFNCVKDSMKGFVRF
jgi:predicted ATP-dependent serine protease